MQRNIIIQHVPYRPQTMPATESNVDIVVIYGYSVAFNIVHLTVLSSSDTISLI